MSWQITRRLIINNDRHSEDHGTVHQELNISLTDVKLLEQF